MKTLLLVTATLMTFVSAPLWAHENHGDIPGTLKAQHGGIPKGGKEINMEMLPQGKTVLFYPSAHPGDTLDISKVTLSGTAKSPKGKVSKLNFTKKDSAFATEVDLTGTHRLNLEIKAEIEGKVDTFKFVVEK